MIRCFVLLILLTLSACYKTVIPHVSVSKGKSVYQVIARDTLYSVAKRYGVDYHLLARRNHIDYPYHIYIGQRLYLKGIVPRSSSLPLPKKHKKTFHRRHVHKKIFRHNIVRSKQHKYRHRVKYSRKVYLHWPVRGRITRGFGIRHGQRHDGIDIRAREGTPVHAAAAGEVVYSSRQLTGYGNLIIIRHNRDMFTAYAHNQVNLVHRGEHVKRTDIIARVGHTGRTSGSNLHFEVRRGPTPVNPLAYLPKR